MPLKQLPPPPPPVEHVISFRGVPVETLSMLANVASAAIVLFATIAAIYQLNLIRKQEKFDAYAKFMEELEENREARQHLFTNVSRKTDWKRPSHQDEESATKTLNFLNRTAMLIAEKRLPCRVVLRLFHTSLIRCWYLLEPFAAHKETLSGSRQGRQVAELAARAKRFHDTRPMQRENKIYIYDASGPQTSRILIYETTFKTGFEGFLQRAHWRLRWMLRRY
jgi:hypothetical protein